MLARLINYGTAGYPDKLARLMISLHVLAPVDTAVLSQQAVFNSFLINVTTSLGVVLFAMHYAVRQTARAEAAAEREYQRSEALLANILPAPIAERLKEQRGRVIADSFAEASVLFADMAGFTARSGDTTPDALVAFLNDVFTRLDEWVERHGLEKIKTTGDSYMVVGGVPQPRADHVEALADLALAMREALTGFADPQGRAVGVRIRLASGPVVAGVVGRRKFFYDASMMSGAMR
jgi:adenylate cyclase